MKEVNEFFARHRLREEDINIDNLVGLFNEEMLNGLEGKESSLRMIPTYIEAENEFRKDTDVLAIDAGGTNFRSALIKFTSDGEIQKGKIDLFRMPGLEKEISSKEFFTTIASYIKPLADKTDSIGFCFSYPTEILPDRDGRLIRFCKEVQAPEVVGQLIGRRLLDTLGTPHKKIVILNDTVATLLAGKSASFKKQYDSFIGYILGTGTNTCYIEQNDNILKNKQLHPGGSQIINIESGNFSRVPRSDLDIVFDKTTTDPGMYCFEKMFAGGYFGGICLTVLKAAASEGFFPDMTLAKLNGIEEISSGEVNDFIITPENASNILMNIFNGKEEAKTCKIIIERLIDRAAKLAASNLAAVVLKTAKGKDEKKPVLITIEGSAFYKLHRLKERFEIYFNDYLSGEKKRFVELTEVEHSSLIGAALAALTS
jgi:hexokinase